MLINLHVKNLALIEETEVDFTDHLNILTGETGAGKTTIARTILRVLQEPPAQLRSGQVLMDGTVHLLN